MPKEEYNKEILNRFYVRINNDYLRKYYNLKPIETDVQDTETILYKKFQQDCINDVNIIIIKNLTIIGNDLIDSSEDAYVKENSTTFKNKLVEYIENLVKNGFSD